MKTFALIIALIVSISCSVPLHEKVSGVAIVARDTSSPTATNAKAMVTAMKSGINLGQTFEYFYKGGGTNPSDNASVKKYIDAMVTQGYRTIRIPMNWGGRTTYTANGGILKTDGTVNTSDWRVQRYKYAVDYIINTVNPNQVAHGWSKVIVIVNTHFEEWAMTGKVGDATYTTNRARMKTIWQGICSLFAYYPDELVFELFNEPNKSWENITTDTTNVLVDLYNGIYSTIRSFNSHKYRNLLFMASQYGSGYALYTQFNAASKLPGGKNDGFLIGTFHKYPDNLSTTATGSGTINDALDKMDQLKSQFIDKLGVPVVMGEYGYLWNAGSSHTSVPGPNTQNLYKTLHDYALTKGIAPVVWSDNGDFRVYDYDNDSFNELGALTDSF